MNPHDFDLGEGLVLKEEGMLRAEEHAPDGWMDRAVTAIRSVCLTKDRFMTDDVWATGLEMPPEGRAFGPAMMRAAKLGYCQKTGDSQQTERPSRHASPTAIWQSLLYRGEPSPPPKGSLFMSNHHANVLVADPPWPFGDKLPGGGRGAEKHYKVMSVPDIMRFPLPPLEEIAMLVLWRVASQQQEALDVVKAWGFTVKSEIVWVKTKVGTTDENDDPEDEKSKKMGMGHYVRNEHEVALVCTRGSFKVHDRGVRSTFRAPIGTHSEKPVQFFELVERLAGPEREGHLCEMFGRTPRPGWHVYGDELPEGYMWTPRTRKLGDNPIAAPEKVPNGAAPTIRVAPGEAIHDPHKFMREFAWDAAAARAARIDPEQPEPMTVAQSAEGHASDPLPRDKGNLPAHVVSDLGKHPALCSALERSLFVTRAVRCGLLSEEDGHNVAEAWIKLQYRAGPGFFQVPIDPSAPKDLQPGENIGDLAVQLKAKGFPVNLIDLVGISVTRRDVLRAWLDQGGDPPEFLETLSGVRKVFAAIGQTTVPIDAANGIPDTVPDTNGTAPRRPGRPPGSKNKKNKTVTVADGSGWAAARARMDQWIAADMPEEPCP